jgi:cytochrome c1
MELTVEQKRAIAVARARQAQAAQQTAAPPASAMEAPAVPAAPERTLSDRIIDNVIGRDDGVMSPGEKLGTMFNKAGESMTAGLMGDEVDAAITSIGSGTYDERLKQYRGQEAQLEKENPGLALSADIFGAALPVAKGFQAAKGLGLLGRMGIGALVGGTAAGTEGYMEGEGVDDRKHDALVNALIGTGVGAAVPGMTSAARAVAKPFVEPVKSAFGIGNARRASRAIGQAVERSGKTSDELTSAIRQAAQEGQPEYVLADALGHPGQRSLAGLARRPGEGRTEIVDFLQGRQLDQPERVARHIDEGFGLNGGTAARTTAGMRDARSTAADAAYGAARKDAGAVDVRGALAAIDERLGPMQAGQGVSGGPIDAKLAQFRNRLAGDGTELSNFDRVLDVKKDIQDAIGEATRAGRNNEARLLGKVMRELDGSLEQSSGGYRAANDEFARASRVIEAVDEGATMARPSTRATDNASRFGQMTPDEQAAARVGYGDQQLARVEAAAGPGTNRARPFTSSKSAAERNAMALNPDLLGRRLDRENTMFETTRQALGGSQTADNIADTAESAGYDASAIVNLLTGNFGTGARQLLQAAGQAVRGQNDETRKIIAQALLSREPGKVLAQAMQTTDSDATRRAIVDALAVASGQKTGYLISQNP